MKLGRVIGRVICTRKVESLDGLALLLVQPQDQDGKPTGPAIVCFDTVRAGEGDLVFFEAGKEAAQANPNGWFNPADAAIIGIVDAVNAGSAGGETQRGGEGPRGAESRTRGGKP